MRRLFAFVVVAVALAGAGFFVARPFLIPARSDEEPDKGGAADNQTVPLSEQAQKTLGLVSKPVEPTTFWKKLTVPGTVIDRPGVSDRGVTAPVAGVVTRVRVTPGDVVRPGEELFELRITSEFIYATQASLFDAAKASQSQERKIKRLEASGGAVAEEQVIAAKSELNKINRQVSSFRQLLQSQGLTTAQIDAAETGKFLDRLTVNAPRQRDPLLTSKASSSDNGSDFAYEVQDLKVQLGTQVTVGQVLAVLANHRLLFIEGRAFKAEMPQIEKAAKEGWPIEVEMPSGEDNGWATLKQTFFVRSLGNVVDVKSRTVPFFLPLVNEARDYERDGKTFLAWRFRPGQRVRLHVPIQRLDDVLVLPLGAVAREGAEAFVFRQNGDAFDRKPVVVLYEDRRNVVLTKDSIAPGMYVAQNNAAALNRALKSAAGGGGGHHHHH
jgi:biotin carboxyl carrier protein